MNGLVLQESTVRIKKRLLAALDESKKSAPLEKRLDRGRTPIEIDDPQLSERIRKGEPDALLLVAQTYLKDIFFCARSHLEPCLAEEATQETFLTFIEKAESFEGRSTVRTWLFGILFKKISHLHRKRGRDARADEVDEHFEYRFHPDGKWARPPRPIDDQVYQSEVRKLLKVCLGCLPIRQRMAFILREVEGLRSIEICKILSLSRTNLGVILFRARNRLRECLEKQGVRG